MTSPHDLLSMQLLHEIWEHLKSLVPARRPGQYSADKPPYRVILTERGGAAGLVLSKLYRLYVRAVLCCVVLCCAVLCCAVLCCAGVTRVGRADDLDTLEIRYCADEVPPAARIDVEWLIKPVACTEVGSPGSMSVFRRIAA